MTLPTIQECQQYWDKVANKAINIEKRVATNNWAKLRTIIRFILDYNIDKYTQILEIGPGIGFLAGALKTMCGNLRYVGVDVSNSFCQSVRTVWSMNAVHADAAAIPMKDNVFEWVFAFDSLEHIRPCDRNNAYQEIERVMMPGGAMFINNPISQGKHVEAFDYKLNDVDIAYLASMIHAKIIRMEAYELKGSEYEFIVMQKG